MGTCLQSVMENCLQGAEFPHFTVDDSVAAKASYFNKSQQLPTNGLQQAQYQ
jgi:hypothetical protein